MRRFTITLIGLLVMLAVGSSTLLAAPATQPVKAAKPTQLTGPAGCATSECHTEVKQYKVIHGPVSLNTCDACHKVADVKAHTFQITRQKAELCTYCHDFDTRAMPVVHKPVMAGECLGCHNPHGGPTASMMRERTTAELCARCHDNTKMSRRFMHKPVKDGDCDSCHQSHASKYPKLLDAVGSDLCLYCHKDFKSQMAKVKFVHKAQENGCNECHDAHGSDFPKHVTKSVPDLCLGCHEKIKTQTAEAMYKHPAALGDRACMTCHTAHGGDLAKLLSDQPARVCLTCHNQPLKNEQGKVIVSVAEVLDPATFKHGPIRDGQCGGCHTIHGGESPMLLKQTNSSKFYEVFSKDNYGMCFSCHDPLLAKEGESGSITAFRNGNLNLHVAHVSMAPRGRNCNVCHSTHAGVQQQGIRETVPYGKWQMPITFRKTETGGTCDTGCHPSYGYDRINPAARPRSATRPATRPTADRDEPVLANWTGADLGGAEVHIPDGVKPTVLLFVRAEQPQSREVVKMAASALADPNRARVVVVLSGADALEHAKELAKIGLVAWTTLADPDYVLSRQLGVQVWPATLIVRTDAKVVAHIAGAPAALASEVDAYLDLAAGKIDRTALNLRLTSLTVVSDGPVQKATWHLQMGQKLLAEGKPEEARSMFADGLKLQPELVPLHVGLIEVLLQLQQTKPALEALNNGSKSVLPPWQASLLRAKLAIAQEKWPEARRLLAGVIKEKTDNAEAHYLMGRAYEQGQDWQNAAREYRAAQDLKGK